MKILFKLVSYNINNNVKTNLKGFIQSRNQSGNGSMKVTIVGASGKIGQTLCLMLKKSPLIDELCIHDIKSTSNLEKDLNNIDTKCKVTGFSGMENIQTALQNSKIVAVLVSAPDVDHLSLDKMLIPNSIIVKAVMMHILQICPKALIAIATNPINSIIPLACEILKNGGSYNPNGVFGVTVLDTVRANTLVSRVQGFEPEKVMVPVIGGHSPETIIPVLSQSKPCAEFSNLNEFVYSDRLGLPRDGTTSYIKPTKVDIITSSTTVISSRRYEHLYTFSMEITVNFLDEIEYLTENIRFSNKKNTLEENGPMGPLVSAFAIARFTISLVKAAQGCADVVECAYVRSKVHPYLKYLATPLLLGPNGISKNLGLPELSDFEKCLFNNAAPILADEIKKGEEFVRSADYPDFPDTSPSQKPSPKSDSLESIFPMGTI